MNETYLLMLIERLGVWGVQFDTGLTDAEVEKVQETYGFLFPPDLRQFLQHALPVSKAWLNWRDDSENAIRHRFDWPADGICFDIEHNNFWMEAWGPRPTNLMDAFRVARQQVVAAPTLIPVYSHRFLPEEPFLAGNPILSVYQTDIIHYGNDLASYFANEFSADPQTLPDHYIPCLEWAAQSARPIQFWDDIIFWDNISS